MSKGNEKHTLDSIWGDEDGVMLVICKVKEDPGTTFTIYDQGIGTGEVSLAPYRIRRLIEVLKKAIGDDHE